MQVPPPPRFRPIQGQIANVRIRPGVGFVTVRSSSAAKRAGQLYESKVQEYLQLSLGSGYSPGPLVHFRDGSGGRSCIPDGLLVSESRVYIFEVKYSHMPEAWWQLRRLYEPVVRAYFPQHEVSVCEVCKTYDPSTPFPEPVVLLSTLEDVLKLPVDKFGVFRWRP